MSLKNPNAIIIGASSGLGKSLVQTLSENQFNLIISARNNYDLEVIANDHTLRYNNRINVITLDLEQLDSEGVLQYLNECYKIHTQFDYLFITAGIIDDNDNAQISDEIVEKLVKVNAISIFKIVSEFARRQKEKKSTVTVISSIATIRARSNNIAYSASKIALEYLISGLRHHYNKSMIFQIYRAGYLKTGMTQNKKLLFPLADPNKFSKFIYKNRNNDFGLKYYPFFWLNIALIIKLLPWYFYKKLKF